MSLADALVVLGCRVRHPAEPAGALDRRVSRAAEAYLDGVAPLVVVTGGRVWDGVREADAMLARLVARGVPRAAIAAECEARSTRENARLTARLLRARGATRVAVVTCTWHLPRALADFRAVGLDPLGLAVAPPRRSPARAAWERTRELAAGLVDAWSLRDGVA